METELDKIRGLHHVTAISGPAQRNYDFYSKLLGLRMVKKTVNFADRYTYHLYYGDHEGSPGTLLTFFPWENAKRGAWGSGSTKTTRLAIPKGSRKNWAVRLQENGHPFESSVTPFGESVLRLEDPDGLLLELIETEMGENLPVHKHGEIDENMAIRGIHSVTLTVRDPGSTTRVLSLMGYKEAGMEGKHFRFTTEGDAPGSIIELEQFLDHTVNEGAGVMHHIAFRVKNTTEQQKWHKALTDLGFRVSEVRDRKYFESIYFREPGGVLFEIATDPPGFMADEQISELGSSLKLPEWLEEERSNIEARLSPLKV